MDDGHRPGRFPPDSRYTNLEYALVALFVVVCGAGGAFTGFGLKELALVGVTSLLMLVCLVADRRGDRRNWIEIGEQTTELCIENVQITVANAAVTKVWLTRTSRRTSHRGAAVLELWEGSHRRRVELFLSGRQRRRLLEDATRAFDRASWTYDSGVGLLVPVARWGPGEPVPDLRIRALWRSRDRDPLTRDPLGHRHRRRRRIGRRRITR